MPVTWPRLRLPARQAVSVERTPVTSPAAAHLPSPRRGAWVYAQPFGLRVLTCSDRTLFAY